MREQPHFDSDQRIGRLLKISSDLCYQLARDLTSVSNDLLEEARASGLDITMITIDGTNHVIANTNDTVGQQFMKKKHLQIIFMQNEDDLTVPYLAIKGPSPVADTKGIKRSLLQIGERGRQPLRAIVEQHEETPNIFYLQPLQGPGARA